MRSADPRVPDYSAEAALLALLVAFVLGQLVAWVYQWTHSGRGYSRSFTQSLVQMMLVVSLVMFVIGNSLVTAFGLLGALAIIRFRNRLRQTRDIVFVFFVLVLGLAVGSQKYAVAFVGTLVLTLSTLYLHAVGFGSRPRFDGDLSCSFAPETGDSNALSAVLHRFCGKVQQRSSRENVKKHAVKLRYRLPLRDPDRGEELRAELEALPGVGRVQLEVHEPKER